MKVELDGKEYIVCSIELISLRPEPNYFEASVVLKRPVSMGRKKLFSKSVFTKNATIEDIIKDTWEDNKN